MIQNIFGKPEAYAQVRGSMQNAKIHGNIYFYGMHNGTLVIAEVYGLPNTIEKENGNFYGSISMREKVVRAMSRILLRM